MEWKFSLSLPVRSFNDLIQCDERGLKTGQLDQQGNGFSWKNGLQYGTAVSNLTLIHGGRPVGRVGILGYPLEIHGYIQLNCADTRRKFFQNPIWSLLQQFAAVTVVWKAVLRIRIRMFLGLTDPDPLIKRSGSFYHQAKIVRKTLISTVLWTLYNFLSLKNNVNVPLKSNNNYGSADLYP
jgi:hypothetical protein